MRQRLIALALVFLAAFAFGLATVQPAEAAGGGGGSNCYYTCDCAGNPLRCCVIGGSTFCAIDTSGVFQCPQVYNC